MKATRRLPESAPVIILLAALFLTIISAVIVWSTSRARDEARFDNAIQAAADRINSRMDLYVALLRGGGALFAAENVSRTDWRRYTERLDVLNRYPGVQGVGYSREIPPDSIAIVEAEMHAQGVPDFRVWPTTPREEYHAILYLEPLDERNRAALGYDMYSEPGRREAMARARDSGQSALSQRVTLVQEVEGPVQAGFLVYVPVYATGDIPPDVEGRRRELQGFVYAPFRAGDLFRNIFGTERDPRVDVRVFDGTEVKRDALLYDSRANPAEAWPESPFGRQTQMMVSGRPWTLQFVPTDAFRRNSPTSLVPMVLAAGFLVSLALFILSRSQGRAQLEAERNARESAELTARVRKNARELESKVAETQKLNDALGAKNEALVEANQAVDAARQAAEEANRAKSQFLANMSHELRTPLNAIGGYRELLELGLRGPITEEQRADLARIKHAQEHLLGLINDVLNFAKLEAGRVEMKLQPVSVERILDEVESLIVPMAANRGIRYVHHPHDPDLTVHADPDKFQQILLNLVSNAVKFTDRGGEVAVDWKKRGADVTIDVRDTGRGIPADRLDSIFEPFVQVNADLTRTAEGTGLGLAISHELATAMGGDLTVRSEEGKGSTFTLYLKQATPVASGADRSVG